MIPISSSPATHGTAHATSPAGRGLAGALSDLAYAAVRPPRYRLHYRKVVRDLAWLDDGMLHDIGLARWEIASHARSRAELQWPVRRSWRQALADVAAAVAGAWKSLRERRMTIDQLMVLDERMLKDIGLSRSQIPWVADEMIRRLGKIGMGQTAHPLKVHDMAKVDAPAVFIRRPSRVAASDARTSPRRPMPANDGRVRRAS
jgi:uncharacterized protein YjiS (DUF1127 family)